MNSARLNRQSVSTTSQRFNTTPQRRNTLSGPSSSPVDLQDAPRVATPATPTTVALPQPAAASGVAARHAETQTRLATIQRLLDSTTLDDRLRGVRALSEVQGTAAVDRLVAMVARESVPSLVDAIVAIVRQRGTPRQYGMTLWRQTIRSDLRQSGLDLLLQNIANDQERAEVRAIVGRLLVSPLPEQRRQGVVAHALLERQRGVQYLTDMAGREVEGVVVDAIVKAVRQYGNERQIAMTLWRQTARRGLRQSGLDLLVQHPGDSAEREEVRSIVTRLLNAPVPEQRCQGVNAHADLERSAGMPRLVNMARVDRNAVVLSSIIAALQKHGTQRQLGMALWHQPARPELRQQGVDLLLKNPGVGVEREEVAAIVSSLLGSKSSQMRLRCMQGLVSLRGAAAAPKLREMLSDADPRVANTAMELLDHLGEPLIA